MDPATARELIQEFEQWLIQTKRGGPLTSLERATIDTFLFFLSSVAKEKRG